MLLIIIHISIMKELKDSNSSTSCDNASNSGSPSSPTVNNNDHGEYQVSTQSTTMKDTDQDLNDEDETKDRLENPMEWNSEDFEQEYDEQDLKRIAESLAPRVTSLLNSNEAALEEMLAQDEALWMTHESVLNTYSEDEDDEDDGLEHLRQELEASNDWGRSCFTDTGNTDTGNTDSPIVMQDQELHSAVENTQQDKESSVPFSPTISSVDSDSLDSNIYDQKQSQEETNQSQTYTIYDHAKYLNLQFDDADLGYPTCPLLTMQHVQLFLESLDSDTGTSSESFHTATPDKQETPIMTQKIRKQMIQRILLCNKEYIKPMSNDCLSRIYEGISGSSSSQQHNEQNVQKQRNKRRNKNVADISIKDSNGKHIHGNREILPVRTISIQIRPDVLCGAVMDAVYSSLQSMDAEVTKRQGGHLRALVPGEWIPEPSYLHFKPFGANQGHGMSQIFGSPTLLPQLMSDGMVFVPPFVVDVQLCVKRSSRTADRTLITRIYPISPGQILDDGIICPDTSTEKPSSNSTMGHSSSHDLSIESEGDNWILREASSLFQRMRNVAKSGGTLGFSEDHQSNVQDYDSNPYSTPKPKSLIRNVLTSPLRLFSPSKPTHTPNRNKPTLNFVRFDADENVIKGVDSARTLVTEKLISQFTVTPSIQEDIVDIDPIPSLSFVDWPYIQSSWRFVTSCLNELESRNLAYR